MNTRCVRSSKQGNNRYKTRTRRIYSKRSTRSKGFTESKRCTRSNGGMQRRQAPIKLSMKRMPHMPNFSPISNNELNPTKNNELNPTKQFTADEVKLLETYKYRSDIPKIPQIIEEKIDAILSLSAIKNGDTFLTKNVDIELTNIQNNLIRAYISEQKKMK